ncbi:MAG TPA: response regulator [Tepidisphaeraceae bacterium]|jgi:PAS domain S-box-containing protein
MSEVFKILVIDDDDVDRMAVRRALKSSDLEAQVDEATDAAQAMALLKKDGYDCALLDYLLPDGDGLTVIRELRNEGVSTPIIVMTGQGSEQLAVEMMKAGANDYLSKSRFSLAHLAQAIRAAVRVHRAETVAAWADEKLREEMRITETMYRLAARLVEERDLAKLVQIVTDEATSLVGAEFGAFFYNQVDEKGESYTLYTLSGVPREAFAKFPMPRNTEIFGPTFRGEAPVRLDDVTADPRYAKNAPYKGMPEGHLPVRSYLAVSVVSRAGEVLGGLFFGHHDVGKFAQRDERIASGIAAQAAVAIDNARLYQALRKGEEQYRFLAESVPQIIWTSRPDGTADYFNRGWIEYTGFNTEQSAGFGWKPAVHPDDVSPLMERWRRSLETGDAFDFEYRLRRRDGVYHWHLVRALPMRDEQGQIVRWFGTATDIHDQKQTENALQQAKESAEAANHAKDQFLAVLSHELRTPLTPVLTTVQTLEMNGGLPAPLKNDLEVIRRNVELEARLIDDLLDLTRISKGKVQLNFETVNAHASLKAALDICCDDVKAKGIIVRTELNATHEFVRADPARLQQVFWNIIKNAVKFTPARGEIRVATYDCQHRFCVRVTDTGIGIEADALPRIFDAFEQAEQSIARRFGGLGLGLAISKAMIDQHHGTIRAESEGKDQGTTFVIELPTAGAVIPAPEMKPAPEAVQERAANQRILLVDDHADTNRAMKRLLERLGYEVSTADSVASALAAAESVPFDLLISDIGLPDGSGLELIEQLRKKRPVKGIALSGFGMEEDVKKSRAAGFQDHLTKPINFTRLETALKKLAEVDGRVG